ncbi:ATP-binding cassette transporter [Ganoderma sinense ZZ0214-1]|uniref:ATP-binding cassette transporter n=1 Tax=Ganoderma sinense ZZ0214-1 TaxID=1077348 RepID=A0A2G8RRN8_9APHY|nr:ATP-binding cassette transporter [Ganoderma sinense ZZ0214-1]
MSAAPLLELKNVGCCKDKDQAIFSDVSLTVDEGEVLVLQGRSGSGGDILSWPRASLLPGTPRDFLAAIYTFATHSKTSTSSKASSALSSIFDGNSGELDVSHHDALNVAEAWGIDRELWDRTWANLSGGEAQRIALAIAVGLGTAEVLLLDGK